MRWVTQEAEFKRISLEARTCVYIDSSRIATPLQRLVFDDAQTCTPEFAEMLQSLMAFARDEACFFTVLDPDPVDYFHRLFRKYPVLEIEPGDTPAAYLKHLDDGAAAGPAHAIGVMSWAWVVAPHSLRWFVHALRDSRDAGGHLWIPASWKAEGMERYRFLRCEPWGPQACAPPSSGPA